MAPDFAIVTESRPLTIEGTGIEVERDKDGLIRVWMLGDKGRLVGLTDSMVMGRGDVIRLSPMEIKLKVWIGA